MRIWLAALALALAWAPEAGAVGACDTIKRAQPSRTGPGILRAPMFIGDSSMLLGVPEMGRLGFDADARGCRQASAAVDMIAARPKARRPRMVVLGVGANGPVAWSTLRRALRLVGKRGMLGLVTGAGQTGAPAVMRRFARAHRRRTTLIDWVATNPYRYGGDGIHIGTAGEEREARFIHRHVRQYMPPSRRLARRVPRRQPDGPGCGIVRRGGRKLEVIVVHGRARIECPRARELVRRRLNRPARGWLAYDWSIVGNPPFRVVVAKRDASVVVTAGRPRPVKEPPPPPPPEPTPAPSPPSG